MKGHNPRQLALIAIALLLALLANTQWLGPLASLACAAGAIWLASLTQTRALPLTLAIVGTVSFFVPPLVAAEPLTVPQAITILVMWIVAAIFYWQSREPEASDTTEIQTSGLLIIDTMGNIVSANNVLEESLGYRNEDIRGQPLRNYIGDDTWHTIATHQEELAQGQVLRLEFPLTTPDGSTRWLSGSGRLNKNDDGTPSHFSVHVTNAELEAGAQSTRTNADFLIQHLAESAFELALIIDGDMRIAFANRTTVRALKRPDHPLVGDGIIEYVDPAHAQRFFDAMNECTDHLKATQTINELRMLGIGGQVIANVRLLRIPGIMRTRGVLVCGTITTDQVLALRELRANEARFSQVFADNPDAIMIVRTKDNRIIDFNRSFTRILEYRREQAIGEQLRNLGLWADQDVRNELAELIRKDHFVSNRRTRLLTRTGKSVDVEITLKLIELDGDMCILCIGRDISEKLRLEEESRKNHERFEKIFRQNPDGVALIRQSDGLLIDVNGVFETLLGFNRDELVGNPVQALPVFKHVADLERTSRLVEQHGRYRNYEMDLLARDGSEIPTIVSASAIDIGGEDCALCVVKDASDLRRTEARLRTSEERFRGTFENAPIGIILLDLQGNVFEANRFAEKLLAYDQHRMSGTHIFDLLPPGEQEQLERLLRSAPGAPITDRSERRMICRTGLEIWTNQHLVTQNSATGEPAYLILQVADITEVKISQERMERMAFYDTLTNLANRRLFNDRLERAIEQCQRNHTNAALLYLDLDHFKRVNDTLGHEAGDSLLKQVGERLTDAVRKEDTVGRLGGDEFAVLLTHISTSSDAGRVAEKIAKSLTEPMAISGHNIVVTTSIGITVIPNDGSDANILMKNADLAMYRAKEQGRNNYQYFSEEMNTRAIAKLKTENELRTALEENQFELFLQPKIQLHNGQLVGFEALLRWHHPERGILTPDKFIDVAEETGSIVDIGQWVIREACALSKQLQDELCETLQMAINISPRQFADPHFVSYTQRCIRKAKIDARTFEMEITETMLMEDAKATSDVIEQLHDLGVQIAIDDFGTGYSSLSYLKRFPIHTVKVDRSFIKEIPSSHDDMAITAAVIAMAHQLKMSVVAEGIETQEQLEFLLEHDCEMGQGYLYSKPLPLFEILEKYATTAPHARSA